MILFEHIEKSFGLRQLFENITLRIDGGEMVAIIGSSGVGKSTLVHMLLGTQKPDKGRVEIDGFSLADLSAHEKQFLRRSMGMIFQDFKLLRQKTVFENVAFAMEMCGESDDEIEHRVPEILRKVHLQGFEHKFPQQLSGGEKQRVAIARALIHRPSLLIADEPTGNLDPLNALEIGEILKELNEKEKMTILITTHDRELVDFLRPRVVLLEAGQIISDEKHGTFWGGQKKAKK